MSNFRLQGEEAIRALEHTGALGALWDDLLYGVRDEDIRKFFWYKSHFRTSTFRLVGPYVFAESAYLIPEIRSLQKFLTPNMLQDIVEGNVEQYVNLWNVVAQYGETHGLALERINDEGKIYSLHHRIREQISTKKQDRQRNILKGLLYLYGITQGQAWKPIIYINAFCRSGDPHSGNVHRIAVLPIKQPMLKTEDLSYVEKAPIVGLHAHDISVLSYAQEADNDYQIRLSKQPQSLTDEEVDLLVHRGLLNIPEVLKQSQKISQTGLQGYVYRPRPTYVWKSAMNDFMDELDISVRNQHYEQVTDQMHELSTEALGLQNDDNRATSYMDEDV